MNTSTLALLKKHFDLAIIAPDGIKRLRELILTLAMQGKLGTQDTTDQSASDLLKEIEAEKKRLVKEGKIKEPKQLPGIKEEDVPYAVPQGWVWVRLGEIADYNGRGNASPSDISMDAWILDLEDIEKETSRIIYRATYKERQSKSTKSSFFKGDVLYGKLRPYLDKVVVADMDGFCTTEIVPIVPYSKIDAEYLRKLLKRPSFLNLVNSLSYGVKMPRLGTQDAVMSIHPLPPLAEQKRIVAKIDQLMATCDALEQLRNSRQQMRQDIHSVAITRLLDATQKSDVEGSWAFLKKHFGDLYSVKENVTELRKAILQLAVMGKLVSQDPKEQSASELLKEIQEEKKRLVMEGKINAVHKKAEHNNLSVLSTIPFNWSMATLIDLGYFLGGKTPSTNNQSYWNGNIPWVSSKDMKFPIIEGSEDFITEAGVKSGLTMIPKNSVLMVVRSGILRRTFPVAINNVICTINQDLKALVPYSTELSKYLFLMLRGFENYILTNLSKKGVTVESITFDEFISTKFPLPPLAEQKRIVAKVNELMALCEKLEQGIDEATKKQSAVLEAVLAAV